MSKTAFYADYIYYNNEIHSNSYLLVTDNIIDSICDDIEKYPDYKVKKFNNSAIFPGLINTHNHLGMGIMRGYADDLPLMTWLNDYIWPAERKILSGEFVYYSTLLSLAESIRSGVTCINDMYFFAFDAKRAFEKAGIRGVVGFGVLENFSRAFKAADEFEESELVKLSICPHALYTVPFDVMKQCCDYAKKRNVLLHTHLAETLDEEKQILEKYNKRPVELMYETGAFDTNSVFAHCVHINDDDMKIMTDKKVNVSHCLESNLKLASGFSPVKKMLDAGINVSIGTDGVCSNNDLSMIGEMSTVSKFHKAFNMDATALSADTVLQMASSYGTKALNLQGIGTLNKGMKADFFVLSFDAVHLTPVYNPVSHLVYAAKDNDITDVYVNGSPVMQDRKLIHFDEEEIKNYAREKAKILLKG